MNLDILIFLRSKISKNIKGHQSPLKKKKQTVLNLGVGIFWYFGPQNIKAHWASQPELEIAQNGEIPPKYQAGYFGSSKSSSLIFWSSNISSLIFWELQNIKISKIFDILIFWGSILIFWGDFPVLRYFELRLGGPMHFDILRSKISKNADPKIWNSFFFFKWALVSFDIFWYFGPQKYQNIKIHWFLWYFDILIFW